MLNGLMPPEYTATVLFDPQSEELRFLPECPRALQNYQGNGKQLGWVAIQHGADVNHGSINVLDLDTLTNRQFDLNGRPGFFCETTQPGVVVIGLERRLMLFDLMSGNEGKTLCLIDCRDDVIINDGLAVEGGVLFGTKHLKFNEPVGAVYFWDSASREVHMVFDKQFCSNGKFFQRIGDSAVLIDIDSIPKTISRYVLDLNLKHVLGKSLVVEPDALPALPDGLRPAPDGESVVVAFYNPAEDVDGIAQQIALSDGSVLCNWRIPGSPRVTCPEFVQVDGATKVIFTTAVEGMPVAARRGSPGAGVLFIADSPFGNSMPVPPPLVKL